MIAEVTLLWALRSPCNLGCRYCYFGTIEDHRDAPPNLFGTLSHLSRSDLDLNTITTFAKTLRDSRVKRVFLAGGEPLIWPQTFSVVDVIKAADVQVVLCTNGIPLNRPEILEQILRLGVDAVSISLDSPDPVHNDTYRPARNGTHGFHDVVSGTHRLLDARGPARSPRVGLYTVVTRRNIESIVRVAALAASWGCDYFVPQPISLATTHPLFNELSLTDRDVAAVQSALDQLYTASETVVLPTPTYRSQFTAAIASAEPATVRRCFGGADLFFIEPDGSVFDCPSSLKISSDSRRRTIAAATARELFGTTGHRTDCHLFTRDCVNMWPLMGFDTFVSDEPPS